VAFIGGWIGFSVSNGTAQTTTAATATPGTAAPHGPGGEVRPVQPVPAQQPTLPRVRTSRGS
jgi:hypothetical protein